MDYKRGRQVILHDPRLSHPNVDLVGPPGPEDLIRAMVLAPDSWWTRRARPDVETVGMLFGAIQTRVTSAQQARGYGQFDALHIMAHGNKGVVQLGKDWLTPRTASALSKVKGLFRFVVFHCCLVGKLAPNQEAFVGLNTWSDSAFARQAAQLTGAEVILGRESQVYGVSLIPNPVNPDQKLARIDFGTWDGPVDHYRDGLSTQTYNGILDDSFDLEKLIFPPPKGS